MKLRALDLAIVAAAVLTAALLLTDAWPGLRGPEEWRWGRRVLENPASLLASVAVFAATAVLALRVRRTWAVSSAGGRAAMLAGAAALVFLQMIALTAAEPGGLSNLRRRVLDPSFTSYHTIATRVDEPIRFLREYHEIQEGFPVHGPSQPPGRVLFFWAANGVAGDPERGASLAAWLLLAAGALCVVPLAVLAGGRCDSSATGAALLLFATVPSILIFTPQTDHLILLATMSAAALAFEAWRHATERRAFALAAAAGVVDGGAMFVSLTSAAAIGAWGLALALHVVRGPKLSPARIAALLVTWAVGFLAALAIPAVLGMNWPAVVRECLAGAHRVQVLIFERHYSTWVGWNLADFALFLGPPLAIATLASWRHAFAIAMIAALLILDLSGTILGETGRIWMFLMPLAVPRRRRRPGRALRSRARDSRGVAASGAAGHARDVERSRLSAAGEDRSPDQRRRTNFLT